MLGWLKKLFMKPITPLTFHLTREPEKEGATLGILRDALGNTICQTLELPWLDNKRQVSCIPVGLYLCKPYSSAKYKNVWELQSVPNRSAILIHSGNTTSDIQGCILLGMERGRVTGKPAVLSSKVAINEFRSIVGNNTFWLNITR